MDLISSIDNKTLKSPLTWFWFQINGHQDDQIGTLDIWDVLNVVCDTVTKQTWILYQGKGINHTRPKNIQDKNWRPFTNFPRNQEGKDNTAIGEKVSTNLMDTIDNPTLKKNLYIDGKK